MNCRSSTVRGSMSDLEVVDEAMEQKLRRQDGDQRHVILLGDRSPRSILGKEQIDRARLEDTVAPYAIGRQQIPHVVAVADGKERSGARRSIWLLGTPPHRRRHDAGSQLLEQILFVETTELQERRHARTERDDVGIEERKASLDTVSHRDAIALRR